MQWVVFSQQAVLRGKNFKIGHNTQTDTSLIDLDLKSHRTKTPIISQSFLISIWCTSELYYVLTKIFNWSLKYDSVSSPVFGKIPPYAQSWRQRKPKTEWWAFQFKASVYSAVHAPLNWGPAWDIQGN